MPATDTFGKITPDNRPGTRRTTRRDPDEDTPTAAAPPAPAAVPPPVAERPTAPGPNDPLPGPPGPPQDPPPHATPGALAARRDSAGGGTLDAVLTAQQPRNGSSAPVSEGVSALMNLANMADRPTDPMQDWVGDGTRTPKFLAEALRLYARLTGRKTQEVMRDCLLGTDAIPGDVLDASWLRLYGTRREDYDPSDYR